MSRRAAAAALESIDGVDFGARANIGLEPFAADYVDWAVKPAGDVVLQSGVVEDGDAGRGIKFNHDVDVAVGPIVAARTRTEQCHMTPAGPSRFAAAWQELPQHSSLSNSTERHL